MTSPEIPEAIIAQIVAVADVTKRVCRAVTATRIEVRRLGLEFDNVRSLLILLNHIQSDLDGLHILLNRPSLNAQNPVGRDNNPGPEAPAA